MATISSFLITNFKGAAKVRIDFENRVSTPVITLIGLNESGKTTILEALSYFVSGDNSVSSLFEGAAPASLKSLIPIHKKAAFTGEIEISGQVVLDEADIDAIVEMAQKITSRSIKTLFREKYRLSGIIGSKTALLKIRKITGR